MEIKDIISLIIAILGVSSIGIGVGVFVSKKTKKNKKNIRNKGITVSENSIFIGGDFNSDIGDKNNGHHQ